MLNSIKHIAEVTPHTEDPFSFRVKPVDPSTLPVLIERFKVCILSVVLFVGDGFLDVMIEGESWAEAEKWLCLVLRNAHVTTDCKAKTRRNL